MMRSGSGRAAPPRAPRRSSASKLDKLLGDDSFLCFAVILLATGRAVGWTTYLDISPADERLEIGWTWYGSAYWRSAVDTEAKLLLLTHAFEDLGHGSRAVEDRPHESALAERHRTPRRPARGRAAAAPPAARWHVAGDSVYFSMLKDESPSAKQRLTERLAQG